MVNAYQQRASILSPVLNKYVVALGLACALLGAVPAGAETEAGKTLKPYSAQYKTTARGMALKLNRKLEANADGSFTLTNGGKIMVVGFQEMSVFSVDGAAIQPKSYVCQGTGQILMLMQSAQDGLRFLPVQQIVGLQVAQYIGNVVHRRLG